MLSLSAPQQAAAPVIAVLATHGRFPQPETAATQAPGVAGLVLRDGISVVPAERYDVELQLTEDMPARFGGFLTGAQVGMRQAFLVCGPVLDSIQYPGLRRNELLGYCSNLFVLAMCRVHCTEDAVASTALACRCFFVGL